MAGAKALLDQAGWKVGADGVRTKDGVKMEMLFQTSTNAVRQNFQALIKQWWTELGVRVELRNISGSVFFGVTHPHQTRSKFYADVEMYANNFDGTDPEAPGRERVRQIPRPKPNGGGNKHEPLLRCRLRQLVKGSAAAGVDKRGAIAKSSATC